MGANNAPLKYIPYYYNQKNGMFRQCTINAGEKEPPWGVLYDMPEDDQHALATLVLVAQETKGHFRAPSGEVKESSAYTEEGYLYIRVFKYS